MAGNAGAAFEESCRDITRLLELHGDVGGDQRGRRYGVEVLKALRRLSAPKGDHGRRCGTGVVGARTAGFSTREARLWGEAPSLVRERERSPVTERNVGSGSTTQTYLSGTRSGLSGQEGTGNPPYSPPFRRPSPRAVPGPCRSRNRRRGWSDLQPASGRRVPRRPR